MNKKRTDKIKQQIRKLEHKLCELHQEYILEKNKLETYVKKHKSLSFDKLQTSDTKKLWKIYEYFDKKYSIDFQGGLRCDERGMGLYFWLDDDPNYLIIHLVSTCANICFSGSTSWLVKAVSFDDKIKTLAQIKKDIEKILK